MDIGCESTDSALAWAWEHWDRLRGMSNPAGYLYRVAQTQARRTIARGRPVTFPPEPTVRADSGASIDGDLAVALLSLPDQQRLGVLMVHVYGLRHLRTSLSKGNTP